MDRYDDEDVRPRRRVGDEIAPRSRRPDDLPARREPLMQRRLRAARGEVIGPDDQDAIDDDYEPVRYRRPQGNYPPSYRGGGGGGGGGCATAVLYLLVGGAIVFVVFLLLGRQLFGSVTGGVSTQIRQIIATPTPTIRDRGGTILQIRNLNRLETQSFSVERVIEAKSERGNLLDTFLSDKLLLIASGNVVAGVDLSKLRDSDVTLSPDGKSITLRLPPSEIFSKSLDNDRTRVYDRQTGLFANQQKDLETQARQEAEAEILNAACEGKIMQKAADEAQRSMEHFLRLLDFETVTVTATPGACVAAPSTLGAPTATTP
jgi:Protein of unknown function (DUF4230)